MEDSTDYEQSLPVPDLEELLQEDVEIPRVPVSMELGTVYRLPGRRAVLSTDTADIVGNAPVCVASLNPKRNRLTLISIDEDVYIAGDSTSRGSIWPKLVPYVVEHCAAVYVRSAHASNTTTVGCTVELWAD